MSHRTITYRICDGCSQDDLHDGAEIIATEHRRSTWSWSDKTPTIDLCLTCSDKGRYICNLCQTVHSDDNPCERQKARIVDQPNDERREIIL
jgi:hypothetical protein